MEELPTPPTPISLPAPPVRHPPSNRRGWRRVASWGGELITVFVGVYAAFTLNNYNTHRQERLRRAQILDWAQQEYSENLESVAAAENQFRTSLDQLKAQIAAGQMPPLLAANSLSDYNPTDFASVLQSGGFDLLEIATVRDLRAVEGSMRQLMEQLRHEQQLSDALIVPNLDQPAAFFYDPDTHQLRASYRWYLLYKGISLNLFAQVHAETVKVLAQIQVERRQNR